MDALPSGQKGDGEMGAREVAEMKKVLFIYNDSELPNPLGTNRSMDYSSLASRYGSS